MFDNTTTHIPMNYVDPQTGEVVPGYWGPTPSRFFCKCELDVYLRVLMSLNVAAATVLASMVKEMSFTGNTVVTSYKKLSKKLKVDVKTIQRSFVHLQKLDVIRFVQNGVWMVNPGLCARGTEVKVKKLYETYYALKTLEERTKAQEKETKEGVEKVV